MATTERIDLAMSEKKTSTRLALVEQSQNYIQQSLDRIERKIENVDKKVDRVEVKIYSNLKWFIGLSIPSLIALFGLGMEMYQFMRQH